MSLSPSQHKQVELALRAAFNEDELNRLVFYMTGQQLYEIVRKGTFNDQVFDLVNWANRNGHVQHLVDAAIATVPGNPELQKLALEYPTWLNATLSPKAPERIPTAVRVVVQLVLIAAVVIVLASSSMISTLLPAPTITPIPLPSPTPIPSITASMASTSTGVPTPTAAIPIPSSVTLKNLLRGENDNSYRIEATVLNPLDQDSLMTHIRIKAEEYDPLAACCCGEVGDYKISDQISVITTTNSTIEFESKLDQVSQKFEGYDLAARGSIVSSCQTYELQLDFDTSLLLPKKMYSAFLITLPKQFTVVRNDSYGGLIDEETESRDLSPRAIDLSKNILVVEVTLDSQEVISRTLTNSGQ